MNAVFERMNAGAVGRFALLGCHIPESGLIAGVEKLEHIAPYPCPEAWDIGEDNCHYPLNYAFLLRQGIPALIARAQTGLDAAVQEECRSRLAAIIRFLEDFRSFIASHAALAAARMRMLPQDAQRLSRIAEN